jgi:PTH1 family peptidyl-tRNA hydrolase
VNIFKFSQPSEENEGQTYVLAGLGNPGREYRNTRHNVGFMVIDSLCSQMEIRLSRLQSKALVGYRTIDGIKVILAKPQTYMNLSGQPVNSLVKFYKINLDHLLVIHDDLDLPLGTIRIRPGGGSAGQKGLASVIQQLGTQEFPRLRIGIGHPPGQMSGADYVLQDFLANEAPILKQIMEKASKAAQLFFQNGLEKAMNQYNGPLDQGG